MPIPTTNPDELLMGALFRARVVLKDDVFCWELELRFSGKGIDGINVNDAVMMGAERNRKTLILDPGSLYKFWTSKLIQNLINS